MMPAAGSKHLPQPRQSEASAGQPRQSKASAGQPQVPMEVGRNLLTLEPLRSLGPDALDTKAVPGIAKITLREIEIT